MVISYILHQPRLQRAQLPSFYETMHAQNGIRGTDTHLPSAQHLVNHLTRQGRKMVNIQSCT